MTRSKVFIFSMFVLATTVAAAQTYLISGTPTPYRFDKFAVDLWRLDADLTVVKVSEIVPQSKGVRYIDVCSDCRQAVFLTMGPDSSVIVLGLDQATVVKTCGRPKLSQDYQRFGQVHEWLADIPVSGPSYMDYFTGSDANVKRGALRAMPLSPLVPCEESFSMIPPSDASHPLTDGLSGVEIVARQEGGSFPAYDRETSQMRNLFDGQWIRTGEPVSKAMVEGLKSPQAALAVNNSDIFVLDLWEGPHTAASAHRIAVFRKRDQSWKLIPRNFKGALPVVRGFGSFVAIIERSPVDRTEPRAKKEVSTNKAWRTSKSRLGPGMDIETFSHETYPGVLHLYNADTAKTFTINTHEPDSEILLVENQTILYRVNDSLFEAKLESDGIGPARLLVQSDVIRDTHWAFTKR